jgi:hypothetical protein
MALVLSQKANAQDEKHQLVVAFGHQHPWDSVIGCQQLRMQILSAPTRAEVDKAHRKGKCDIGVPSIRNLFEINKRRACLWLFLGLSSYPFIYCQ